MQRQAHHRLAQHRLLNPRSSTRRSTPDSEARDMVSSSRMWCLRCADSKDACRVEASCGRDAAVHLFVSEAEKTALVRRWKLRGRAVVFYDRPPKSWRRLSEEDMHEVRQLLPAMLAKLTATGSSGYGCCLRSRQTIRSSRPSSTRRSLPQLQHLTPPLSPNTPNLLPQSPVTSLQSPSLLPLHLRPRQTARRGRWCRADRRCD